MCDWQSVDSVQLLMTMDYTRITHIDSSALRDVLGKGKGNGRI